MFKTKMYNTQVITEISDAMKAKSNINLAFCICDNQAFNRIIKAYRNGDISLESAVEQALLTIKESEYARDR